MFACDRCGSLCLSEWAYSKALERGRTPLCPDCQQVNRLYRVQYDDDYCVPHQGLFDKFDNPVTDQGVRVFADDALCGHRDCVKPAHHLVEQVEGFKQPKHPRRKGFVKPAPKKIGRPPKALPKLVVKEVRKPRGDKRVWDIEVIMALAEIQDFNHRHKKVSSKKA